MGTLLIQLNHSDKKKPEDKNADNNKNADMEEEEAKIIQKTEQQGSNLFYNL
jgi:hypothetical protein